MIRKKILGNLKYIDPLDPAIDLEKWEEEKQKTYFDKNFELPPIKEGETPVTWEFRQLSGREIFHVRGLQSQYATEEGDIHPEIIKYVIQRGLIGWSGLETEDREGNQAEFKPEIIDTPTGKQLSDDCYFDLIGFFQSGTEVRLMALIYSLSIC